MRPVFPTVPALALALLAAGCHHKAGAPINPQAEIAVTVENQNFSDMDIFIIRRGGERIRVGMFPGCEAHLFRLPPDPEVVAVDCHVPAPLMGAHRPPTGAAHAGADLR